MELADFKKVRLNEILASGRFDYFITSPVNSIGCFLVYNNPDNSIIRRVFELEESTMCPCRQADIYDLELFTKIKMDPGRNNEPGRFIEHVSSASGKNRIDFLIDYSCMPVEWYAGILDAISRIGSGTKVINTYMVYLPKKCASATYYSEVLQPLKGTVKSHRKPLSVIVGLNETPFKMTDLEEVYKPREIVAFVPEMSHNPGYMEQIKRTNRYFLDKISSFNMVKYMIDEPEDTNAKLASLCLKMRLKFEVAIMPRGPKIFSVIALLLSMQYPDIRLLSVKRRTRAFTFLKGMLKPGNNTLPVTIKATFCEDIDYLEHGRRLAV